jgi:hypothetical protein
LCAHLAAKHAEVGSLFASLSFRFHFEQIDAGRKWISTGSRSFDQMFSPRARIPMATSILL